MNQRKITSLIKKLRKKFPTCIHFVIQKETSYYHCTKEFVILWGFYQADPSKWIYFGNAKALEDHINTLLAS